MKRIEKLYFLIHGFCYAAITRGTPAPDLALRPYLACEARCAREWQARLAGFSATDGLAIIPFPGSHAGPAASYHAAAAATLGERCFLLDCPDADDPSFRASGGRDRREAVPAETESALAAPQTSWNKEELEIALHCRACSGQLEALLAERGFAVDRASLRAEGWGASFDGCVTKYTLNLRRILGLANVVGIDFGLTVPDARFLLAATAVECVLLANGLRLFRFSGGGRACALFTFTEHAPADPPEQVRLRCDPGQLEVRSKQGLRLWPAPETYRLGSVPPGYD